MVIAGGTIPVIPLGSIVSVPGYGIAIARGTGGAIVGNKIDLHMEDLNSLRLPSADRR